MFGDSIGGLQINDIQEGLDFGDGRTMEKWAFCGGFFSGLVADLENQMKSKEFRFAQAEKSF